MRQSGLGTAQWRHLNEATRKIAQRSHQKELKHMGVFVEKTVGSIKIDCRGTQMPSLGIWILF